MAARTRSMRARTAMAERHRAAMAPRVRTATMLGVARRGVTLVEVAMGMGLMALVSVGVMQVTNDQSAAQKAAGAASMMAQVQSASQDYLRANYAALVAAVPVGASPAAIRAGRASAGGAVPTGPSPTLPSLQGGGFLPPGFIDRDGYRFRHVLLVRQPSAGVLDGLVVQVSDAELGIGADGGTPIRDVDLGRIVARLGAPGGARFTTNPVPTNAALVQGNGGSWAAVAADWSGSGFMPQAGRAAATATFGNASLLSDYLNRYDIGIPEANTMRAALNMGGNDVTAARNVTASATVTADRAMLQNGGMACAANATGCRFWISDDGSFADFNDGWTRFQGSYAGSGLSIEGAGNNLYVGGSASVSGSIWSGQDVSATRDLYAGRNLGVSGAASIAGDTGIGGSLGVARDVYVGQNIGVNGSGSISYDLGIGRDLGVARNAYVTGSASIGTDLGVAGNAYVTNSANIGANLGVAGGIWTSYLSSGGSIDAGGPIYTASNMGAAGTIAANGQITSNFGRVVGNAGVQTGLVAAVATGCADEGTIAINSGDSGMLWCQGGVWRSPSAPFQDIFFSAEVGYGWSWTNPFSTTVFVVAHNTHDWTTWCRAQAWVNGVEVGLSTQAYLKGGGGHCNVAFPVGPGSSLYLETSGVSMSPDSAIVTMYR